MSYVLGRIMADPVIAFMLGNPATQALAMLQLKGTEDGLRAALTARIGTPIGSIPNDVGKFPELAPILDPVGEATRGVQDWVGQLVEGLGGVAVRGGVLFGIVVVGIIGLRMVVAGVGVKDVPLVPVL